MIFGFVGSIAHSIPSPPRTADQKFNPFINNVPLSCAPEIIKSEFV